MSESAEPLLEHRHDGAWKRLLLACVLSFTFFVAELVGGIWSGSLAIFADALHMLADLLGLLLALFACLLTKRQATVRHSFGFHRAEVLCAFVSILTIWMVTAVLVKEAIDRLANPQPIQGGIMLAIAAVGLVFNVLSMLVLGHGHDNVNLRAALLHVMGDILASVGVLIAAAVIFWRPSLRVIDPICTFIFAAVVVFTTLKLFRESVLVLMEGTPANIDPGEIEDCLKEIPSVASVHDLHVWTLTPGKLALCVHVGVNGELPYDAVLERVQSILCEKFNVHHTTVQIEPYRAELDGHCVSSICNSGVCTLPNAQ